MPKIKMSMKEYLPTRIKVDENGCWIWQHTKSEKGYGVIKDFRTHKLARAHRVSYEEFVGPIPENKYVCHSCDVPACINPDHLWVGTHKENQHDAISKGRHSTQQSWWKNPNPRCKN